MSKSLPAHTTSGGSIADLIVLVKAHPALPEARKREIASALRTVTKVLGTEPHLVPANLGELRDRIYAALPLAAGVSAIRWRNALSLLRQALALADRHAMPGSSRNGLLEAWSVLLHEPAAKPLQRGLSRFSKYCSAKDITPQAVTQAVFDKYGQDLTEHCLVRSPQETQQTAAHAWNEATGLVPGWPQLTLRIASRRLNPSPPWTTFPDSLLADLDAYLTPRSADVIDFSRDTPVMRAATIEGKRRLLRQFAGAVVVSGVAAESLKSLADLVKPEVVRAGLAVLLARSNQQKTSRIEQAVYLLLSLARHHVRADADTIRQLAAFSRNLMREQRGMTLRNRKLLQQFDEPQHLERLLALPDRMMAEAASEREPTVAAARVAALAVAIEIITVAPLRIGNVAALELGRTLHLGRSGQAHILIDHAEVKNDFDLEVPLPARTARMIATYLTKFHPLLAPAGCRMLFPSVDGRHKRKPVLSHQIRLCVGRRCGLRIHPHLFRHLAAKIYLENNPGDYGTVKLLLGHKDINTTIRTYCGTESAAAFRAFDALLTGVRAAGHGPRTGAGRARRWS